MKFHRAFLNFGNDEKLHSFDKNLTCNLKVIKT